jgi:hypothetical protein
MWLLNTTTLSLSSFPEDSIPIYVILSHTWGSEEISFQEIRQPDAQVVSKAGYLKVKQCCDQAVADGFEYAWVDACCIDKTNNMELSGAINSMFHWYRDAAVCYAYLEDVKPHDEQHSFGKGRRFTRCWTLQELIAHSDMVFVDHC